METKNELKPSAIRKTILEDHAQLRTMLKNIETHLQSKKSDLLIKATQEMVDFFLKHIEREESILAPVLQEIDSWGGVRVDRMKQEHAHQRQEIQLLVSELKQGKMMQIIPRVEKFMSDLYEDMDSEEKECLSPDLLKDDLVTIGNYSGLTK
ncbi:MAG: hypothetical protein BroJett040_26210 [Oligoflexia bacterium]|nr:MAG: hypothetical protein BroJett040_26210 [Oligoflexia bacterium]